MNKLETKRHAYLIICHNNFQILCKLLTAIDDERNDIYVHIDKKTKTVPYSQLKSSVRQATLTFIKRRKVDWGGDSQISVELALLEAAVQKPHSYYHLLSGVDFPLWSQDTIHSFFQENIGKEFIRLDHNKKRMSEFQDRIRYYYPLQNRIGRNRGKYVAICERVQTFLLKLQKLMQINRLKRCPLEIKKGSQWFSITHDLALELLGKRAIIRKYFRHSFCADELFLATLAYASPYHDDIVDNDLRMIDWSRGNPYTYRIDDYEMLISSEKIFARKFDETIDMEIIIKLFSKIQGVKV